MKNSKVLEMLINGQIEELKAQLQDEIYAEVITVKPGAKKRYAAMKKYFTYFKSSREFLQKPCGVEFDDKFYISFCNSYSLALTTEPCGAIELFTDKDRYPDVNRLVNFRGTPRKVDFTQVFADAKSQGYKLKKTELDSFKYNYLLHYDGAYYKAGLLDSTFSIIDDGEEATVYHKDGEGSAPIIIKNSIGICVVMPVNVENEEVLENKIVIEVKNNA